MDRTAMNNSLSSWLRERNQIENRTSSRFRMSQAGKCTRQMAFEALSWEPDISLSDSIIRNFSAGDTWHDLAQEWLCDAFGAEIEVDCELKLCSGEIVTGHADALVVVGSHRVVWEIKSMAPYSWDRAVEGTKVSDPEGVRDDHWLQASLYAVALRANEITVAYVNRATGEWATENMNVDRIGVDDWLLRTNYISGMIDAKMLPSRMIGGEVIQSPPPASSKDGPWQCRYCPYQPTCSKMQSGLVSL